MTVSSTFRIKLRFQGYRCKSGIVIFPWRVTLNYANSPFNHKTVKKVTVDVILSDLPSVECHVKDDRVSLFF